MPNPDRENSEQRSNPMKMPSHIAFKEDTQSVLCKRLLASSPEEGCALLLGNEKQIKTSIQNFLFEISLIWPCSNIWKNELEFLPKQIEVNTNLKQSLSRKNRFTIDPREQLLAQKWARTKSLSILGSAHSHPSSGAIPSKVDLDLNFTPGLIVIVSGSGELRAWWINNANKIKSTEIMVLPNTKQIA